LLLRHKGSEGCLRTESGKEIIGYIEKCEHISTEELRDHIEEKYGVVYKSEQSYYDLPKAGGKSRHKYYASDISIFICNRTDYINTSDSFHAAIAPRFKVC